MAASKDTEEPKCTSARYVAEIQSTLLKFEIQTAKARSRSPLQLSQCPKTMPTLRT